MRESTLVRGAHAPIRPDPRLKSQILGVSHLVLSVGEASDWGPILESLGYREQAANDHCPNPPAKAPFLSGALQATCAMRLMVAADGSPAIEVLLGSKTHPAQSRFDAVLSDPSRASAGDIRRALLEQREVVLPGLCRPLGTPGAQGVGALVVHVDDLEAALPLWRTLGYADQELDSRARKIEIRGLRPSNRLDVYFVSDRDESGRGDLDAVGVVCLSLFCKDADRLRAALAERGYEVGDCFSLTPFSTPLRVFFMRNTTGEIYEFLSIPSARAEDPG